MPVLTSEQQYFIVKQHILQMDALILYNKNIIDHHKKCVTQAMKKYPDSSFERFFVAVRQHDFIMTFFDACKKLNVNEAKRIHNALKKQDEKVMNKQLFEKDKTPAMMFLRGNGDVDKVLGTDEVTRNFADTMKKDWANREYMIEDIKLIRKKCQMGILLVST